MSGDVVRPAFDFRTTSKQVKPRTPYADKRPLVVVTRTHVWSELTGEVTDRADLPDLVITHPSSIFACENAPALLIELGKRFVNFPGWMFRVTPVERRKYRPHRTDRPTVTRDVIVNYFGFRFPKDEEGKRFDTFYHFPIDTLTFLGGSVHKAFPDAPDSMTALIEWATDVRAFARENGLKVGATTGGLAAQLLRDPRFFPAARRKVPRATNDKARPYLPGNHYELFMDENRTVAKALYLDMTGAHHYAATQVTFPHPDRLYARGAYHTPPTVVEPREPWARSGRPKCEAILTSHGLFLLRINVPHGLQKTTTSFPPPWLRRPAGLCLAYVYSNELPLLAAHGVALEGVEAAWTAGPTDDGLNKYAAWSIEETAAMTPKRKAWAKPALLAAYGLLAARPRNREFGYLHAKRGIPHVYMTAGGPLEVETLKTSKELDSNIANVIARGMIEAEVRMEVLRLASEIHARGCKILALYADSIILSDDSPLPLLPDHWRVKTSLTRLEFFNPVSFHSEEMTRLPGVPEREVVDKIMQRKRTFAGTNGWGTWPLAKRGRSS